MFLFHPLIVHFAIALLTVAVACDFLYLVSLKKNLWSMATNLLTAGSLFAIAAVITGSHAHDVIEITDDVRELVNSHRASGQLAMWLFIVLMITRFCFIKLGFFKKHLKWLYYLLAIIAVSALLRTGLLGGNMVYFHGVGINKSQARPPALKPSFEE